jgi:hypothetical protein
MDRNADVSWLMSNLTQVFFRETANRAANPPASLPEHGPAFGLGKGETGAVPGHGAAWPDLQTGFRWIVRSRDGPLEDRARYGL